MASGTIRINTDEVRAIASEIERINGHSSGSRCRHVSSSGYSANTP